MLKSMHNIRLYIGKELRHLPQKDIPVNYKSLAMISFTFPQASPEGHPVLHIEHRSSHIYRQDSPKGKELCMSFACAFITELAVNLMRPNGNSWILSSIYSSSTSQLINLQWVRHGSEFNMKIPCSISANRLWVHKSTLSSPMMVALVILSCLTVHGLTKKRVHSGS